MEAFDQYWSNCIPIYGICRTNIIMMSGNNASGHEKINDLIALYTKKNEVTILIALFGHRLQILRNFKFAFLYVKMISLI